VCARVDCWTRGWVDALLFCVRVCMWLCACGCVCGRVGLCLCVCVRLSTHFRNIFPPPPPSPAPSPQLLTGGGAVPTTAPQVLALASVFMASINIFGGFHITGRMLVRPPLRIAPAGTTRRRITFQPDA